MILGGSLFNTSGQPGKKSDLQKRCEADLDSLLNVLVAEDSPLLGAGYGVGFLGVHQDGVTDRKFGEPVGISRIRVLDAGRNDPLLAGVPDEFDAFVGHKEAVLVLPKGAVLLADSAACPAHHGLPGYRLFPAARSVEIARQGL